VGMGNPCRCKGVLEWSVPSPRGGQLDARAALDWGYQLLVVECGDVIAVGGVDTRFSRIGDFLAWG
jgi:hypothetical protein